MQSTSCKLTPDLTSVTTRTKKVTTKDMKFTITTTMKPLALLTALFLWGNFFICDAFSIQSCRQIKSDCSKLYDLGVTKLSPARSDIYNRKSINMRGIVGLIQGVIVREIPETTTSDPQYSLLHLLQSFAIVGWCRRLSLFILSVSLVNYSRSSIFKVSVRNFGITLFSIESIFAQFLSVFTLIFF